MEWFSDWWALLTFVEQVLYCIAIPSTVILLIQTVLLVIGFGGAGEGVNVSDTSAFDSSGFDGGIEDFDGVFDGGIDGSDGNVDVETDGSAQGEMGTLSLFTVQGIVSFLCIFSWSGIVLVDALHILLALLIAFALGFLAMFGVAKIIQLSSRLAQNGTMNMKILLGETGTVYIPIPASGKGHGKVNIQLAERFVECDAVNEGDAFIPTNSAVRVIDILSGNILVVEKLE